MSKLKCRVDQGSLVPFEFIQQSKVTHTGILRMKCLSCGYEPTIAVYSKEQYNEILSQLEPREPIVFNLNGE